MKKTIKLISLISLVAVFFMLAVTAVSTPEVTLSLNEVPDTNGGQDVIVNVNSQDGAVNAFEVVFTFNNTILLPADCGDYSKVSLDSVSDEPVFPASITVGKKTYSYALTEAVWTTEGDYTKLKVGCYTTDSNRFDANDLDLLAISFIFADGKTVADLKSDDFVINSMYIADGVNGEYGYNMAGAPTPIVFINNVVPAAPAALTIPVAAGDVIYFADGTTAVAEAAGDYEVPAVDGIIAVNTGYDSQKVYEIADGKLSERTDLADGVLATPGVSIRKDEQATGIRFKSTFLTALKATVKEYGYIVTVDSAKNALPEDYTLNMALVDAGKAKKGVAYSNADGTDIFYDVDGARTVVTMVTTGIPLTETGVTTDVIACPYYILENGAVIYGETNTATAYQIAYAVREQGGTIYEENKEYVDAILALVSSENDGDNFIDMSYLFE